MAKNEQNAHRAPSRARRFLAFLSAGHALRVRGDRWRQERARLRTARALALWQRAPLRHTLCRLRNTLFMTELRAFAFLLMPMALYATGRDLLLPLLSDDFALRPLDGAAGAVLLLLTLLLLTYKAPLYRAVTEDRLLSHLFFESLALPRPYITMARGIRGVWFFLAGLLLALLSVFVSPFLIAIALLSLLILVLTTTSPEFLLLLLGALFPLAALLDNPAPVLAAALGVTLLSYLFKLFLGKRDFYFEPIGLFLLIFSAVFLVFSQSGSTPTVKEPLAFAAIAVCGYFLTANLLSTKRTAVFFSRGMIFTATALSIPALFCEITALLPSAAPDGAVAQYLLSLHGVLFPTTEILTTYLLLLLPLLLGLLGDRTEARLGLILPLLILLATLILSIAPMALVAFTLSLVLFTLLNTGSRAGIFFFICTVLPNAACLITYDFCDRVASLIPILGIDDMIRHQHALLVAALEAFLKSPVTGGTDAALEASSLYLGIGLQSGILGILSLLLLLVFVARDSLRTAQLEKSNRHRTLPHGCASALFAAMVYASFQNILLDIRTSFLFFLIAGMLTAVCRIAWQEDELHRRHMQDDDHESYATELKITH